MTFYTLHYQAFCPFSRQIRLMAKEKNLDISLLEEKITHPSTSLMEKNPTGTLPVLVVDPGIVVVQEYAIIEYMVETRDHFALLGNKGVLRNEVRRLIHWFNGVFYLDVVWQIFHEKIIKTIKKQGYPQRDTLKRGGILLHQHLCYVASLCNKNNWLAGGPSLSMADLVAASHLSCLDYMGEISWESYPAVKEWYVRIKSRPSFQPFLRERIPGFPPHALYQELDF